MNELSLTIKNFNDKVRLMNQTHKKELTMTAEEVRNLHSEIFGLLAQIAELTKLDQSPKPAVVDIKMDGGNF